MGQRSGMSPERGGVRLISDRRGTARGRSLEVKVAREDARRFLVARQLLAPARSLVGGPDAVLDVLRRLGSIQLDPVEVAGRSHDLVLHASPTTTPPGVTSCTNVARSSRRTTRGSRSC